MKKMVDITNLSDRELDALVAEHVMGKQTEWLEGDDDWFTVRTRNGGKFYSELAAYSTDIAAAWEVVEKLTENLGTCVNIDVLHATTCVDIEIDRAKVRKAVEETTPRAICLAALRTKGVIE